MKNRFTMNIPNTPENRNTIEVIRAWSDSIPTVYFLDICSISRIKTLMTKSNCKVSPNDQREYLSLKKIDLEQNAMSYMPALMEKVSDQNSQWTINELIEEAAKDLDAIGSFFERARIFETKDFVFSYIRELKGAHPEILGESYHAFLNYVNASGIYNSLSSNKRMGAARSICNKADEMMISRSHPVVLASLACIYGCLPAKNLMKFKKNNSDFNPSNALGDIQIIQRIGLLTRKIEDAGRNGTGAYLKACFITADKSLEIFYNFFNVNDVKTELNVDGAKNEFSISVKSRYIFPDLYNDVGDLRDSECERELVNIYDLIRCKESE